MIEYIMDYENGYAFNGVTYNGDDVVVAEGRIGRIVTLDDDRSLCCLDSSIGMTEKDVGHFCVCTMIGMRKANREETEEFNKIIGYGNTVFFRRQREESLSKERY